MNKNFGGGGPRVFLMFLIDFGTFGKLNSTSDFAKLRVSKEEVMKHHSIISILIVALLLTACNLPASGPQDSALQTQVAQTVTAAANVTQPVSITATVTLTPIATATATLPAVTNTPVC